MVRQEQSSLNSVYFEQKNNLQNNVEQDYLASASPVVRELKKGSSRPNNFDVAVIGSGIAGLTSAAYLSKAGLKVIVLERDVHPGGCAASFKHNDYQFAVGATVAMGFEPQGLHRNIYKDLGITPEFVNVNPAIRVHLPDRSLRLFTQRAAWHNYRCSYGQNVKALSCYAFQTHL